MEPNFMIPSAKLKKTNDLDVCKDNLPQVPTFVSKNMFPLHPLPGFLQAMADVDQ